MQLLIRWDEFTAHCMAFGDPSLDGVPVVNIYTKQSRGVLVPNEVKVAK
jgi:hypothetical protein